MENEDYIKKWLDNSLTKEERALFEQTEDYRFVQKLSGALKYFRPSRFPVQEELEKLNQKKHAMVMAEERPWFLWLKAAAAVLLVLGLIWYFVPYAGGEKEYVAKEKIFASLPDSSIVRLNNDSKLTFDPGKWNGTREAFLEGEGYFVVKPGETFDIISSSGKVSVLGTSFNIKDRENFFEVTCFHGSISVTTSLEAIVLSPGQSYRIINNTGEIVTSDLDKIPAWLKGESSFNNVPYIQVLQELERQYSVRINTGSIDTKLRFTGKFTHSDLNLALKSITLPMNIGFKVVDSQVRLVSDKK